MAVLSTVEKLINERVIACYEALGYLNMKAGKTAFAEMLGVSNATLSKYMSLDRPFPVEALVSLSQKHPEISTDWLLKGEGQMLKGKYTDLVNAIAHKNPNEIILIDNPESIHPKEFILEQTKMLEHQLEVARLTATHYEMELKRNYLVLHLMEEQEKGTNLE